MAEGTCGGVIGGLLTPLGLLQAVDEYAQARGIRGGLARINHRLLRALQSAGVVVHRIEPATLVWPEDGPLAGDFHRDGDSVIPAYCLIDEIARAIGTRQVQ